MRVQPVGAIRATRALLTAAFAALAAATAASAAGGAEGAPWPTAGWQVTTPEAEGVSSAGLADLVEFGAANAFDSVLVTRHGKIVLDVRYAPFKPGMKHAVNSVTKGVVGTLAGIALKEGKLERLDAPVLGFFPERTVANLDEHKKAMTLQSLLDMTSGLSWREPLSAEPPETMLQMERSADWIGFVLDRPMAQAPGASFNYDSGTWQLVSAIVGRQAGADALAYAREKLFAPLGITDVVWRRDPQGVPIGGYGLFMQPHDMAKLGYLYLRRGEWEGRQVLPREWVARVFDAPVDMRFDGLRYANGWWSLPDKRALVAVGFLRQLIVVLPEVDVVAIVTGRRSGPFGPLIDPLVAAVRSEQSLPADPAAAARLAERITEAGVEKRSPVAAVPSLAASVSGKTYRIEANGAGITSIRFDFAAANPRYETTFVPARPGGPIRRIDGPLGLDGLFRVREPQGGDDRTFAVKGNWRSENSFEVVTRSLTEGVVTMLVLTFDGPRVELSIEDNRGIRLKTRGEAVE